MITTQHTIRISAPGMVRDTKLSAGASDLRAADKYSPSSSTSDTRIDNKKPWTVLYYMAGNNSISEDMLKKIGRMESVGSDFNLNLVVQLGRASNAAYLPGGHRFYIQRHDGKVPPEADSHAPWKSRKPLEKSSSISSKPIQDLGPVDMSNPGNLTDFIQWGMKNYPAEHTLVVIMDHGYGYLGSPDDNEVKHTMTINEMDQALAKAEEETGQKIDILGFDTCLMAQAEVAHQLKERAQFLVGSEELEYPLGWPEGNIMSAMKDRLTEGGLPAADCASLIVDVCGESPESMKTTSALELNKVDAVTDKADKLAGTLLELMKEKPEAAEKLRSAIKKTHNYCLVIPGERLCQDYRDFYDLGKNILKSFPEPAIREASKELMASVKEAVAAENHNGEEGDDSHGISVYIPTTGFIDSYLTETGATVNPRERYLATAFAAESRWDELIEGIKEPSS